jgi:hypothetical protein
MYIKKKGSYYDSGFGTDHHLGGMIKKIAKYIIQNPIIRAQAHILRWLLNTEWQ